MAWKSHDYFEHDADVGIIGRGETLEAAFEAAAQALFAIMGDPEGAGPFVDVIVEFDEADLELALVRWLNQLLSEAQTQKLLLSRFRLEHDHHHWRGAGTGEPWNPHLVRGVEVKGATLTMLSVRCEGGLWEARCIVDV